MNHSHLRRAPVSVRAIALMLTAFFTIAAFAEAPAEAPKVDLEKAKAELAKAKSADTKKKENADEKTPRKRLFSRKKSDTPPAKKETAPKPKKTEVKKKPAVEKEEKDAAKRTGLFFNRKNSETKKVESLKEAPKKEKPKAKPEATEKKKRFALFGKDSDEPKKTSAKKEVAKVAKPKTNEKRVRLIGRMLAKDSSEKEPKEETPAKIAKVKEKAPKKESGGSRFGFFKTDESKKFAKAEKTKLGKSIGSKPKATKGGSLTKKSSSTGELGWYVITEAKTPFYAVGPGQPMPPEKILDRGSMLTVTKGGWGWCNVKLGGGELGVISSKAMRPATIAEVSRHTTPVATASKSRGSRKLFNIIRGPAPKLTLPSGSSTPIRNFGLLPSLEPSE